jgi:hypothetical protein
MTTLKKFLLLGVAAAAAVLLLTAGTARADYGDHAVYQVEISSNPPGFGFWMWAELDPGMTSGDYQETDCIHLGGGHIVNGQPRDAAAHDSGSVTGWSVDTNARTLTLHGVNIIGNAETVDVTVPLPAAGGQYGHVNSVTLTYVAGAPILAGTFPAQVQLAP